MSQIMIRVPVAIAASILAVLACAAGASAATVAAPAGRWPAPLDIAPPTICTSNASASYDCGNTAPRTP
jgi:hypothetical protein